MLRNNTYYEPTTEDMNNPLYVKLAFDPARANTENRKKILRNCHKVYTLRMLGKTFSEIDKILGTYRGRSNEIFHRAEGIVRILVKEEQNYKIPVVNPCWRR